MKVVQILKHLDKSDLQRAKAFMSSIYFKNKPEIQLLFDAITKRLQTGKKINKKEIWEETFSTKPFNDLVFRKTIHELLNSLQKFFVVESVLSDENAQLNFLANYCESHQISSLKNNLEKKLIPSSLSINNADSVYNVYSAKLTLISSVDVVEKKKEYTNTEVFKEKLTDLRDHLESFYLIERIRLALMQNNSSELTGLEFGNRDEKVIENIPKRLRVKFIPLEIYYQVYNLLINGTAEINIDDFISYLKRSIIASFKEALTLYGYLNNYYTRKINSGESYYIESFKILRFGIESRILLRFNEIDPIAYRNIIVAACRVHEYNWALEFVEDYKNLLSPEHRQSAYSFSKARIFRSMGRYEELVKVLRDVEYEDITYNLNSRLMLIMAFYELDEYDTLDSTIKAFKVFLRRKRNVSTKRKANFTDFCDVVYNLVRAGDRKDVDRLSKAKHVLASNAGIPSSGWLKEKIAEVSEVLGIPKEVQPAT